MLRAPSPGGLGYAAFREEEKKMRAEGAPRARGGELGAVEARRPNDERQAVARDVALHTYPTLTHELTQASLNTPRFYRTTETPARPALARPHTLPNVALSRWRCIHRLLFKYLS